jgi:large subunit ribosomal protein L35
MIILREAGYLRCPYKLQHKLRILEGECIMAKMKLKTNRSAHKRLKVTGTGKITRNKGWKRHLLSGKNATRKRRLSGDFVVDKDNIKAIQRMLPYGLK